MGNEDDIQAITTTWVYVVLLVVDWGPVDRSYLLA